MIGIAIFGSTLLYLRWRKRDAEVKTHLQDFGVAALATVAAFVAAFMFHLFLLTPKTLYESEHAAKEIAETSLRKSTPSPMQFEITERDQEARQKLADTQKRVEELEGKLREANETIAKQRPIKRYLTED